MDWIVFALLAPLIYTVVNFTDKFVIGKAIPDANSIPVFLALVHAIIAMLLWAVTGFPLLEFRIALSLMLTGIFVVIGTFMLFRALIVEETSKIVMWTQILPVISLILAYFFLNERLTASHYIGFTIIFIATIGLAFEPKSFRITASFGYILIAVIVWSISDILLKLTLNQYPELLGNPILNFDLAAFLNVIIYQSAGFALGGFFICGIIPSIRHDFIGQMKSAPRYALGILFANETLFIIRQFVRSLAIALGPVALVSVLDGTRIFLGIIVGWVLTLIAPKIFAETITSQGLKQKFLFSTILFIGILVVSFS